MKTRANISTLGQLGRAVAVCALAAASPAMMAQEAALPQDQASRQAQAQIPQAQPPGSPLQDPVIKQEPAGRTMVTGSNIARVRKEPAGLPLVVLDRSYIDQTGAPNSREMLQTVPQIQIR
jgi:hypothetical protein